MKKLRNSQKQKLKLKQNLHQYLKVSQVQKLHKLRLQQLHRAKRRRARSEESENGEHQDFIKRYYSNNQVEKPYLNIDKDKKQINLIQ